MVIEFDGQKFKSKKERNKYCYYNLKKLKERFRKGMDKIQIIVFSLLSFFILLGIVISQFNFLFSGFIATILVLFSGLGLLLFGILYENEKLREIKSWAEDYEVNYKEEIEKEKRMVEEYERKCEKCGEVWHSLVSDEKGLRGQQKLSGLIGASMAFSGNLATSAQSNRNAQASVDRLKDLKKCPKCGSQNYSEKITKFEKKD